MTDRSTTRIDPTALGLAMGTLWAGGVAALGLVSRNGWGEELREAIASVYLGYDETDRGILVGALWGFADALIAGVLLGWLYNAFDQG